MNICPYYLFKVRCSSLPVCVCNGWVGFSPGSNSAVTAINITLQLVGVNSATWGSAQSSSLIQVSLKLCVQRIDTARIWPEGRLLGLFGC